MQWPLPEFGTNSWRKGILSEQRINQVGFGGLALSFVLLVVALLSVLNGFAANSRASGLVDHTHEVKATIANAANQLERSISAHNGYLLDPHPDRLRLYRDSARAVGESLDALDRLTLDNLEQRERVATLRPLIDDIHRQLDLSIGLARDGELEVARELFPSRRQPLLRIRALTDQLSATEESLLDARLADERRSLRQVQNLLIAIAIALVFTALGTIWLLRRNVKLLHASRADLQRLNLGLESAVAARTADFKRANEEIQRFAYIVSHDLRSPLVNVLGFTAELEATRERLARFLDDLAAKDETLVSAEADMAVREDLPEAIEFIRSSSERMDRLINAILGLSRQGRRVLQPETLRMDDVLQDIAGSLATLAEERGAEILIETPLPEIRHDRIAIEQIFTNLMENALKYLRAGVPGLVRVRGRTEGDKVLFEVKDNGRGIKEADFQRVFDLFRRSGVQDQPGEGIGLANVRALAYRLGGTVDVSSRFGEGSVFAVTLPREFLEDERDNVV
jgi:signal transduction histidine kinase